MSERKDTRDRREPEPEGEGPGARGDKALLPDLVRRAFTLGLSGLFTTEEAFRRALGETVPKDWVDFAVGQSDRTRSELTGRLAEEVARVIENLDLEDLLRRLLLEHRVEIRAELNLVEREPDAGSGGSRKKKAGSGSKVKVVGGGKRR